MSIIFIIILLQGLKVKGINSLESKKIEELSKKITKRAGTYILKNVNKVNVKNYKTNSDGQKEVVTQIDLDIHNNIQKEIKNLFPNHNILSEEDIDSFSYDFKNPLWIIDPLDGTSNFSNGLSIFGSQISYIEDYKTRYANIYIPSISSIDGDYIFWSQESGLSKNNITIEVNNKSNFSFVPGNLYTDYNESKKYSKVKHIANDYRNFGSISFEGAMVALGKAKSMLCNNPKIWDVSSLIGIFSNEKQCIYLRDSKNKEGKWKKMKSMEEIYKNIDKKSYRIGFDIIFTNK